MTASSEILIQVANRTQRWVRDRPSLIDIGFGALVFAVELIDLVASNDEAHAGRDLDLLAFVLVALGAVALVGRRQFPVGSLVAIATFMAIFYVRDYGSFMSFTGLAAFYGTAAHSSNRRNAWLTILVAAVGLFTLAVFTVLDRPSGFSYAGAAAMLTYIGLATFVGVVTRNREQIFMKAEARADRAEADRAATAERAVAKERLRIAREMHDVVAHGMSVISVQAAAAQEVARNDPDRAVELMKQIEATGRESLTEMRRMLAVLRNHDSSADDSPSSRGPQPRLSDLEATIEHCREAGLATEFTIAGDERPLSAGRELTVFRIVQEALTNVLKHGGSAATAHVRLDYRDSTLLIQVTDTGRGVMTGLRAHTPGNGLLGMRERVELYDGELTAGPKSGGGYSITAVLPIDSTNTRPRVVSAEKTLSEPETPAKHITSGQPT